MKGKKHKAKAEAETIIDIMINGGASAVFHGMSEDDVKRIMQYPFNMFASDASIRVLYDGMPHPRGYGTNARVLGKVCAGGKSRFAGRGSPAHDLFTGPEISIKEQGPVKGRICC